MNDYVGRHRAPGRVRSGYRVVVHHTPRHSERIPAGSSQDRPLYRRVEIS